MIGDENAIKKINGFIGTDWSLGKITIDDENLCIELLGERHQAIISCYNFIGFLLIGNWDEAVIECIWIESKGDLINNSIQEIKRLHGNQTLSNEHIWHQLNIKLINGNIIKIACEGFKFEV